ncbi:MAG TPA: hypothetical protein VI485_16195 [Vicinamibacterales bacterium]|nr:hypothetical protein [Vicinamibacterales bacterium]
MTTLPGWLRKGELWDDELPRHRRDAYERLEAALTDTVRTTWARYDFDWGVQRLTRLGQFFGFLNQTRGVHLLAQQQLNLALFNVHQGRTARAQEHARTAFTLYKRYHWTVRGSDGIRGVIEALGAIAHAKLLAHKPLVALRILAGMETLHRQHHVPMLAEFHRKRGVAFLQLATTEHDVDARRAFSAAAATPAVDNNVLDHRMASGRHLNLLNSNYDGAGELLLDAAAGYGSDSLQKSMCIHWDAAVALATDSPQLHQEAYNVITLNADLTRRFGHQATISYLLLRTDALGMPTSRRREWVRVALYSNAFRGD